MAKRSILGQIETLGNPNTPMGMACKRVTNDIGWGMRLNKELMAICRSRKLPFPPPKNTRPWPDSLVVAPF